MKLQLISKKPEVEGVISLYFEPEKPMNWLPGQYMHYALPHPHEDDRGEERWFTISTAPFEKNLRITTRESKEKGSTFKNALFRLKVGDEIEADGPSGRFVLEPGDVHHILIAGGIGITPYRSQLAHLDHLGLDIKAELLYANSDDNLVFGDELKKIEAEAKNFHIHSVIGRRLTEEDFKQYSSEPNAVFYLSGPEPLVENYYDVIEKLGIPAERIKKDYFPGY